MGGQPLRISGSLGQDARHGPPLALQNLLTKRSMSDAQQGCTADT